MARTAKLAASPPPLPSLTDRLREISGYVVFAAGAFLLIACLTFVERDAAQAGTTFANRCGHAGYVAARATLYGFGYGAYLGIFILFLWSFSLIGGRSLRIGPFRIFWLGGFVFAVSGLVSHLGWFGTTSIPDPGGLIGRQIADRIEYDLAFGPWGTRLALLVGTLISFQLATDFVLLALIRGVRSFMQRRREQASKAMGTVGPLFQSLLARREEARAAGIDPDTRPRARSRAARAEEPPVEVAISDADVEGFAADEPAPPPKSRRSAERKEAERKAAEAPVEPAARPLDEFDPADVVAAAQAVANSEEAERAAQAGRRKRGSKDAKKDEAAASAEVEPVAPPPSPPSPGDPPPILAEDPESEVVPPPPIERKVPAKIHLEPPTGRPSRGAGFENETTIYAAPPAHAPTTKKEYEFPPLDLLEDPTPIHPKEFQKMIEGMSEILESSLRSYKVDAQVVEIQKGPVITMFEINVVEGTRVDRIRALEDDLAIRLKVPSVRIVAPLPGKSTIGIEVPNRLRETVCLRELLLAPEYESGNYAIPLFLGKDAAGRPLVEDLAKMPHLLVAGATGAGKSVCLNAIIMSVLYSRTPDQVKMILIDPKMVELSLFENIPHLACPVVRDMNRAAQILEWACAKMDERYELMAEVGARNIFAYNKLADEEKRRKLNVAEDDQEFEAKMPFVVIVVDELADLMMVSAKDVENHITRLAQKSRAVGIHIILATQRPSTNVITGLIKANLPTRCSFQVASKIDSRVVLDQNGAEKLLGFGDMLYLPPRTSMLVRGQGAFVADDEIRKTVEHIRVEQPQYTRDLVQKNARSDLDPREIDDLYDEATRFVCETKRGSASLLQRRFSIGYTRASRLIDLMAGDGILGEYRNAQAREVLLTLEEYAERERQRQDA